MAIAGAFHGTRIFLLACFSTSIRVVAGQQVYYYTGAYYVHGHNGGSWAVQAQCPASNPVSCSAIQQPDYCCPTDNYCAWADNKIACCPNDCTCTGWSGTYQPTSWYAQPSQSTHYWRPSSTHYYQSTYVAPAAYTPIQSTVAPAGYGAGQYCSTLYAHGPNLPTTAQGDCGVILIMDPDASPEPVPSGGRMVGMEWLRLMGWVTVLQVLGGLLFGWR